MVGWEEMIIDCILILISELPDRNYEIKKKLLQELINMFMW